VRAVRKIQDAAGDGPLRDGWLRQLSSHAASV